MTIQVYLVRMISKRDSSDIVIKIILLKFTMSRMGLVYLIYLNLSMKSFSEII
jgi:hypothetical protein